MTETDRRSFLKMMGGGAVAASMPRSIVKALSIPAASRTGTINDVEHIVVLTQENRSFDHYFGTLRGVRGFDDPRAVTLPNGRSVWRQPNGSSELLPFRPPVASMGETFLPDPPHGWNDTHAAWNDGRFDQWVPQKGVAALTHHVREDLPYHFALADAFTICDAYHCSVMGPTDPNRYHLWTGWLGNDGRGGGPVINNAEAGYDWSSFPERLERAGVSWKVYQDAGHGLDAAGFWGWTFDNAYIGNYGDNALLYLHQYQHALPGNPLADKAKVGTDISSGGTLFDQLRSDVKAGTPQVSWIAAPEAYTEHPNWAPNFGAWYISQVLDALTSNSEVWSKTVFLLNYDEEGGFFDHIVPPTPPMTPGHGASTVSTVNEIFPGDGGTHPVGPYGLGIRVPMIVVSPWSKGGYVNSQVFDHTSIIKFIEKRFGTPSNGLTETNITPWRRAVVGDLTSAFDFTNANARTVRLPSTSAFKPMDASYHADFHVQPPSVQSMPRQERGVRPARALPYALEAQASIDAAARVARIECSNSGAQTAVFHIRSANTADTPRSYTVEPGRRLAGTWPVPPLDPYGFTVFGPNGFYRRSAGSLAAGHTVLDVQGAVRGDNRIAVRVSNPSAQTVSVTISDAYRGERIERTLAARAALDEVLRIEDEQHGWYDVTVAVSGDALFAYQLAGHVETGTDSFSDPAMGGVVGREPETQDRAADAAADDAAVKVEPQTDRAGQRMRS